MDRINLRRVITGGLVAGLVLNVGHHVLNRVILRDEWYQAMRALTLEPISGSAIAMIIVMLFVLGIVTVWLYAAMRPRFGPGPRTAVLAGLAVWFFVSLWPAICFSLSAMFPTSLLMTSVVWRLVEIPLASLAGAWLYKEESATPGGTREMEFGVGE